MRHAYALINFCVAVNDDFVSSDALCISRSIVVDNLYC